MIKIGDFGLAKYQNIKQVDNINALQRNLSEQSTDASSGAAGTRKYMAPEWKIMVDKESSLSGIEIECLKKLDIYAMGIILCDLICNART